MTKDVKKIFASCMALSMLVVGLPVSAASPSFKTFKVARDWTVVDGTGYVSLSYELINAKAGPLALNGTTLTTLDDNVLEHSGTIKISANKFNYFTDKATSTTLTMTFPDARTKSVKIFVYKAIKFSDVKVEVGTNSVKETAEDKETIIAKQGADLMFTPTCTYESDFKPDTEWIMFGKTKLSENATTVDSLPKGKHTFNCLGVNNYTQDAKKSYAVLSKEKINVVVLGKPDLDTKTVEATAKAPEKKGSCGITTKSRSDGDLKIDLKGKNISKITFTVDDKDYFISALKDGAATTVYFKPDCLLTDETSRTVSYTLTAENTKDYQLTPDSGSFTVSK